MNDDTMFGLFLALYCGLSAEGTSRTRACLAGYADAPDATTEERNFYLWALEQIATVHGIADEACAEPQRPQLQLIHGGKINL